MQKKTKLIGNIIFMLLLLGATMYLLLKDQDLPEIRRTAAGGIGKHDIICCVVCGHVFDLGIHVLDRYIALAWRAYAFFPVAAVFFYRLFV